MCAKKKSPLSPNSIPNKEMLLRMNFMHLMAAKLTNDFSTDCMMANVARSLCNQMKGISRKLVQRIDPHIKRTICKNCNSFLIPSHSAALAVLKEPKQAFLTVKCNKCSNCKKYLLSESHILYNDQFDVQNVSCA